VSVLGRRCRLVALAIGAPLLGHAGAGCGGSTTSAADAPAISNLTLEVEGGDGGAVWGQVNATDPAGLDSPTLDLVLTAHDTSIFQDAVDVSAAQGDTTAVISFLLEVPPASGLPSGMWTAEVTLITGGAASNTLVGAVP
jgi:hypothetical protein